MVLAEIGDKTQLLAFVLAARFRKSFPVVLGILVATAANHALAGAAGAWIAFLVGPQLLRWSVGLAFLGMTAWTLIPDKLDTAGVARKGFGAFGTTVIAFFIVEMGDKTQIATVALARGIAGVLFAAMGLGVLFLWRG